MTKFIKKVVVNIEIIVIKIITVYVVVRALVVDGDTLTRKRDQMQDMLKNSISIAQFTSINIYIFIYLFMNIYIYSLY